jgi:AcrR family transcriptional regulator
MSDAEHTSAALVEAAERLFAAGGEQATSLRSISRAARANPAAVHYHFGGRDELLRAVLHRHLEPLAQRRLDRLDAATARHPAGVPVPVLLDAVIRPDLELLAKLRKRRVELARFLGRASTLPGPVLLAYREAQLDRLARRLVPLLATAVPGVAEPELRRRVQLVADLVAAQFARAAEPGEPGSMGSNDIDEQVRRLVAFCAPGMAGPEAEPGPEPDQTSTPDRSTRGGGRPSAKRGKKR